ncbi:MAG: DUF2283 domain-containing protein [Candidatus Woesearchaeota archaeon]
MAKINYDQEDDILSLSKEAKVKHSIDIGDFIVDIDHKGFVAGIEILNASENLNLSSKELALLEQASMVVSYKPNHVCIAITMKLKDKEKDITIPITVDLGHAGKTEKSEFAA